MNNNLLLFFLFAVVLLLILFLLSRKNKKDKPMVDLPGVYIDILKNNVSFYTTLSESARIRFEQRVQRFLASIRITGVNTTVEDIDRVFIGASAIIPIFSFPDWEYINLHEVLLYPDIFSEGFEQTGDSRQVLGMVGNGAMQHIMILSKSALREGFSNKSDKNNTAIHEFVHLIDKTDGDVDGVPGVLLQHQYILPWINMIHKNIQEIIYNHSDINPYASVNQAEFFAVVAEYFFERPDLLEKKHPDLYHMLSQIFKQKEEAADET